MRAFIEGRVRSEDARAEIDLRRLEVVQATADRATAELEASVTWTVSHPVHGEIVREEELSGPVVLELAEGGWRVADVTVNGRLLSRSRTAVPGAIEQSGLRLEDVVLELGARATSLELVLENTGAHRLVVFEVVSGARVLGLWSYVPVPLTSPLEVEAGERGSVRAGWREAFPLGTDELRFLVRAGEVEGSRRFELHFAVRRTPEAELVALERVPWTARVSTRRRRRLRLVPLGAVGIPLALGWLRPAGIVFALEGLAVAAIVGYLSLVRRRGRPDSRVVVTMLAMIAVGVWIAWAGDSLTR